MVEKDKYSVMVTTIYNNIWDSDKRSNHTHTIYQIEEDKFN